MLSTPFILYNYLFIEKINSSTESEEYCDIYHVKNINSDTFTLKLYKKRFSEENFEKEVKIYQLLGSEENPYFPKYISYSKEDFVALEKYIVLEYMEKGMLKDFVLKAKFFPEKLAKIVVWKIFQAVIKMHEMGIAHMNITLERIFLDKFYHLKIADFVAAKFVSKGNGKKKYENDFKEDIYNLAFLIIQILTGKLELKNHIDLFKKTIKKGNLKSFWQIIYSQGKFEFTPQSEDLISKMLSGKESDLRILLNHDWFDDIKTSINQNEFELYEQYMKNELSKYEGGGLAA